VGCDQCNWCVCSAGSRDIPVDIPTLTGLSGMSFTCVDPEVSQKRPSVDAFNRADTGKLNVVGSTLSA